MCRHLSSLQGSEEKVTFNSNQKMEGIITEKVQQVEKLWFGFQRCYGAWTWCQG